MKQHVSFSLELFNQKDEMQFKLVHEKHYDALYLSAMRLARDPQLAKAIVSEAFTKCWKQLPKNYENEEKIANTLFVSVRNLSIDYYRKEGKVIRKVIYPGEVPEPEDNDADRDRIYAGIVEEIHDILDKMPDEKIKKIFNMRYVDEISVKEIAEILHISETTVREYQKRGIQYIRETMARRARTIILIIALLSQFAKNN